MVEYRVAAIDIPRNVKGRVYKACGMGALAAVGVTLLSLGLHYTIMREWPAAESWHALGMLAVVLAGSWLWAGWVEMCVRAWETLLPKGHGTLRDFVRVGCSACAFLFLWCALFIVAASTAAAVFLAPLIVFGVVP